MIVVMLSRPIIDTFAISIFISFLDNVGNEFKVIPVGLTVFNRCLKNSDFLLSFFLLQLYAVLAICCSFRKARTFKQVTQFDKRGRISNDCQ